MSPYIQVQFNMELGLGTGIWIYTFVSSEITASEMKKPLSFDTKRNYTSRVSFKTNFDSKQTKLEPKLVLAIYETKRLFWLFRFYTETESFGVLIEPKQTEEQPKQCDREHTLVFFHQI